MREQWFFLRQLACRLGIAVGGFSLCRVLFWLFHRPAFEGIPFATFLYGLRFDLSAILYLFAPVVFLQTFPFPSRGDAGYQRLVKVLFHTANTAALFVNCVDLAYYRFAMRRVSVDTWNVLRAGEDFWPLLPRYIVDFWPLWAIFLVSVGFSAWLYGRTQWASPRPGVLRWPVQSVLFVLSMALTVVGMRGGIQMVPIGMATALQYADGRYAPAILNGPFSLLMTLSEDRMPHRRYFPPEVRARHFDPVATPVASGSFRPRDVVVIVMESLSREFVGRFNGGEGYTPFFDSLVDRGLSFDHAFANGTRSVEAIPAILSSIPVLADTSYLTSSYAGNRIDSLASLLGEKGYETAFFHGGTNGTMHFDAYSRAAGFSRYHGRREYGRDADYDGHWGIYDKPFFRYFARSLSGMRRPFFAALFSLSAHHPFAVPPGEAGRLPPGRGSIHRAIAYADEALRDFFAEAAKAEWFRDAVFVITGDHTSVSYRREYHSPLGLFRVPLLLYAPDGSLRGRDRRVAQHLDILPSVLDLLRYDGRPFVAFGRSVFDPKRRPFAVHYSHGVYQWTEETFVLRFDGERDLGLYHHPTDMWLGRDLRANKPAVAAAMGERLKAFLQAYDERVTGNALVPR